MYDYLVAGAGLFGAVFASEAKRKGRSVLVVERRGHIGGNIYTEEIDGIQIHAYGPHIFHTRDERVWRYVNRFARFNHYVHSPVANYHGEMYSLPFNMHTFSEMWGVSTAEQAAAILEKQRAAFLGEPQNLEEQALRLVGRDIYEKLIKGYTEKQWGRECTVLPAFIIRRLPVRMTFDSRYFDAPFQGVPEGGYTKMVQNMLDGSEVLLNTDYLKQKLALAPLARKVVYTGAIDEYFHYALGPLEYRSVAFKTERLETPNYQGNAVVNFTDRETPYTRIIEHKWFDDASAALPYTIISREYSAAWKPGDEPYYPVNDDKNNALYQEYVQLAAEDSNVIFGGRLGSYQYADMDAIIWSALALAEREFAAD